MPLVTGVLHQSKDSNPTQELLLQECGLVSQAWDEGLQVVDES